AHIIGHTLSISNTVQWLHNHPAPDLIFMDIELADGQCFEIFNQVEVHSPIIFTTSYDEYALRAFKLNSIDYLLKPVRKEELEHSISKFLNLRQPADRSGLQNQIESLLQEFQQRPNPTKYRHRFLVKQGQRLLSIDISEIAWFHAEGKLCFLKTWENQRYLIDYTLEELDNLMDPHDFFRVNRGYLVNIKSIKNINPYFKGKLILQLSPKTEDNDVVVSKEKASEFKAWLGK
ncbi:MAG: response regulator transcription factor, partial [Lewinella sp.]|nr:response regulator transcription factor [Lewinella sp.]